MSRPSDEEEDVTNECVVLGKKMSSLWNGNL